MGINNQKTQLPPARRPAEGYNSKFTGEKRAVMKKISRVFCLILAAMMMVSLSACKSSLPVMLTYKDKTMSSGMYAFALAERKGEVVDYFSSYSGQDISSDETFWSAAFGDTTYEDWLKDYTMELCKNILLTDFFCKEFDLKITDDTTLNDLDNIMENAKQTFGGEDELALELAKYGITIEQLRDYYSYYYKYQLLLDYWYGENGTMKIPKEEVSNKFFGNYYKVDMAAFSFYTNDENGNTVAFVDKNITDEQAKDYFNKNYVKVKHILYMTVDTNEQPLSADKIAEAEKNAKETYEAIKNGTVNYDDKLKEKSDTSSEMVFTRGEMVSEFETASFEMKTDELRLVQTKYGWHIIKKLTPSDDDFKKNIDEVKQTMSKEKVTADAKDMIAQLKENKIEFKEGGENASYQFLAGRVLSGENLPQDIKDAISALKTGEYTLYEYKEGDVVTGYYIFKRVDLAESDLDSYYDTIEDGLKQTKYSEYIKTYYDSITVNQNELEKYNNIPAVKSFPSLAY
jgi:hypothetical protein